jgi:hypothetical protein
MRSLLLLLCIACSSQSAPPTLLQPAPTSTSQASALVAQTSSQKTKLDLSGEFQLRFSETEYYQDPIDIAIIIRSDNSIELRQKVEMIYKGNKTTLKEYPGDGKVKTGTITPAEMASLKSILESEAFFSIEESYRDKMYDVPSYSFHVQTPTQSRSFHISGTTLSRIPAILQSAIQYTRALSAKTK